MSEPKVLHEWSDTEGDHLRISDRDGMEIQRANGSWTAAAPEWAIPELARLASLLSEREAECASLKERVAKLEEGQLRDRAAMSRALDALEADADHAARRQAFEIIQGRFEGVGHEGDGDPIDAMIETLKREHAEWERNGCTFWPSPSNTKEGGQG